MADLYIYYRVRDDHAALLSPRMRAMQALLGVEGHVRRRPQSVDGMQTWMEIYLSVSDGFQARLDEAVQRAALAGFIDGPRHTEVFTELPPCA